MPLAAADPSRTWTIEKTLDIRSIGGFDLSSDGEVVALEVRSNYIDSTGSGSQTHIWLATTAGMTFEPLTTGEASCTSPSWSPDGRLLSYLSSKSGRRNLWIYDRVSESEHRLTDVPLAVTKYKWSPTGDRIAFLMADMPALPALTRESGLQVVGEPSMSLNLHVVDLEAGEEPSSSRKVTDGEHVIVTFNWSPDGREIAYSHQPNANQDYLFDNDLSVVTVADGGVRPLVRQPGWDLEPMYSPDGRLIAFSSMKGDTDRALHRYSNALAIIPANGGEIRYLPDTPRQLPGPMGWSRDGTSILYVESLGTTVGVFAMPLDGTGPQLIQSASKGIVGDSQRSRDGEIAVYRQEDMDRAVELYARRGDADAVQITRVNQAIAEMRYAPSELIRWQSSDGTEIEGLLTYPLDYDETRRHPLVLIAHAGLYHYTQSHTARLTGYPIQCLAAEGFFVLRANPRGSNNQSRAFRDAIAADWGGVVFDDLMSGVDHLIEAGLVDEERMGVAGWSTGGYATATLISRTNRFAAASLGAAPVDLVSFTNTTDTVAWLPHQLGAEVWQDRTRFVKQSPLFRMRDVRTPVLIQWGERDVRVPISQGYELYHWLTRQGTEVVMQIVPGSGHVPTDPKHLLALGRENLKWFRSHLRAGAKSGGATP